MELGALVFISGVEYAPKGYMGFEGLYTTAVAIDAPANVVFGPLRYLGNPVGVGQQLTRKANQLGCTACKYALNKGGCLGLSYGTDGRRGMGRAACTRLRRQSLSMSRGRIFMCVGVMSVTYRSTWPLLTITTFVPWLSMPTMVHGRLKSSQAPRRGRLSRLWPGWHRWRRRAHGLLPRNPWTVHNRLGRDAYGLRQRSPWHSIPWES